MGFDRLAFVASVVSEVDDGRPWLATPFRAGSFTAATNGHALVGVPREDGDPEGTAMDNVRAITEKWMTEAPGPLAVETSIATLREWAGPSGGACPNCTPEQRVHAGCEACDSEGYVDCECHCGHQHERECRECEGTGGFHCNTCDNTGEAGYQCLDRLGFVGDRLFNLRMVAWALRAAPDSAVTIHTEGTNVQLPILIVGDGFRMKLMPLRQDNERGTENRLEDFHAVQAARGREA